MKRYFRILRVWYFGKLKYARRYKKWMKGRLFRDLPKAAPYYLEKMQERYSAKKYEKIMNEAQLNHFEQLTQTKK